MTRKVIYHAQTTVDGRLARADGELWDHFPWGETEIGHVNGFFRQTDTWVLGREMHDVIVPFWSEVAAGKHEGDLDTASLEFGRIFGGLRIAVFSRTLDDDPARTVLRGDPAAELAALKEEEGSDIMLSCGPRAARRADRSRRRLPARHQPGRAERRQARLRRRPAGATPTAHAFPGLRRRGRRPALRAVASG